MCQLDLILSTKENWKNDALLLSCAPRFQTTAQSVPVLTVTKEIPCPSASDQEEVDLTSRIVYFWM